jgi:hypothetical protein
MAVLIEAPESYPRVITGGIGAIGSRLTIDNARSGIQTFPISTNETRERFGGTADERFNNKVLKPLEKLRPYEGVDKLAIPIPIFVDLREQKAMDVVLSTLADNLHPDQQVHYDSLMAAGFRGIGWDMARVIGALEKRIKRDEKLSEDDLIEATAAIRKLTMSEVSLQESLETNYTAAIGLYNGLNKAGWLGKNSGTTNLQSIPADDFTRGRELVNAFYWGMATGKTKGGRGLEDLCRSNGQRFLNFVASVVAETEVAKLAIKIRNIVIYVMGEDNTPEIQTVTIEKVVAALRVESRRMLVDEDDPIKKVYLGLDGLVYPTRPVELRAPILPFF